MSSLADDFLTEWTLKRDNAPLSHQDAVLAADRWEAEAIENGVDPDDLRAAAGGDLVAYLLRTFGTED
ncbi:hypothetical protein [Sphingomonas profundi]|uniref:hypothetical protein n=1 Tax=Alterirhizorhabdus profundi TaxID=2681549 RepID=UPI0012E8EC25|nr:hypothetical protein [Sphingomonas profundi]